MLAFVVVTACLHVQASSYDNWAGFVGSDGEDSGGLLNVWIGLKAVPVSPDTLNAGEHHTSGQWQFICNANMCTYAVQTANGSTAYTLEHTDGSSTAFITDFMSPDHLKYELNPDYCYQIR
jgi:hypothetical protein